MVSKLKYEGIISIGSVLVITRGGENRPEYTLPGARSKNFRRCHWMLFNKLYLKCLLSVILTSLLQNKTQSNWVMAILCVNFLSLEI